MRGGGVDGRFGLGGGDQEYRDRRGFGVEFLMGGLRGYVHCCHSSHCGLRWRGERARETWFR